MKTEEAKSIIDLVRNSTVYELLFTSLIILPIFLGSWVVVLKQLKADLWEAEVLILSFLVLFYIITLGIMKFYQSKDDKILHASIKIRSYINSKNWKRMSFERIERSIDNNFDSELLKKIIDKYPGEFRKGTIKGGKIALVLMDEEEDE